MYYRLYPLDNRENIYVLRYDAEDGCHILPRYLDLQCSNCGKVDEDKALSFGLEPSIKVPSRRDIVGTNDRFRLFSERAKAVAEDAGVKGLKFLQMPGDPRYYVVRPLVFVKTDFARAGFEIAEAPPAHPRLGPMHSTEDRRCVRCGRYFEMVVGPLIGSMQLPEDPMVVFTSEIPLENGRGRSTLLFVSQQVRDIFCKAKLKGAEFVKAW